MGLDKVTLSFIPLSCWGPTHSSGSYAKCNLQSRDGVQYLRNVPHISIKWQLFVISLPVLVASVPRHYYVMILGHPQSVLGSFSRHSSRSFSMDSYDSDSSFEEIEEQEDEHEELCSICEERLLDPSLLYLHHTQRHPDSSFGCPLCQILFPDPAEELAHARLHHVVVSLGEAEVPLIGSDYSCPLCPSIPALSLWHFGLHAELQHSQSLTLPGVDSRLPLGNGLTYHPRFQLLLCDATRQALDVTHTPQERPLSNHLRQCGHHDDCAIDRVLEIVSRHHIPTPNTNTRLPSGPHPILPFLGEPVPGYICPHCQHGFPSIGAKGGKDPYKSVREHYQIHRSTVPWDKSHAHPVQLQRWYPPDKKTRYSPITASGSTPVPCSPWVIVSESPTYSPSQQIVHLNSLLQPLSPPDPSVIDSRDISSIVERMGWKRFATRDLMQQHLQLLSETASTGISGSDLDGHRLHLWCERYLKYIESQLDNVPHNLRFELVQISQPDARRPFTASASKGTFNTRSRHLSNALTFSCALHAVQSDGIVPERWQFPSENCWVDYIGCLPDNLWVAIERFKRALQDDDLSENEGCMVIGDVWCELWAEHTNSRQSNWDTLMERFIFTSSIAVKSQRSTVYHFQRPDAMASTMSHLTWLARTTAIFGYIKDRNAHRSSRELEQGFKSLLLHLDTASSTPFSRLRYLAKWLSGIVRVKGSLTPNDYFAWPKSATYTSFFWKSALVDVSIIRAMPGESVRQVRHALERLYHYAAPGWDPTKLRERIHRGLQVAGSGYFVDPVESLDSFVDLPLNGLFVFNDELLEAISQHHSLTVQVAQKMVINTTLVHQFLKFSSGLNQALMVATHLCVGTVARGTEVVGQTYRGTEIGGEQSFRLCAGMGSLVSIYMKTRHLNGAQRVVRFLPDELTAFLIEYLVVIRPVESKFGQLFYNHQVAHDYQRFLWLQYGRRVPSISLSMGIGRIAEIVTGGVQLGIKFNLHMWRQVSKAILIGVVLRQTHQMYAFTQMDEVHPAIHYGFGHSDIIGETRYGVDASRFSAISEGNLLAMQDLCQRFHIWAGLSSECLIPPPAPLAPSMDPQPRSILDSRQVFDDMFREKQQELIRSMKRTVPAFDQSSGCTFTGDHVPPLNASVLAYLQDIYGRPTTVKSIAQAQFLTWLMTTQNDIIAVLPTGGGKSLSFLLPALMEEGDSISIVIAPFVAIEVDYCRKLMDLGIPYCQWPAQVEATHRVILVTLEAANHDELLSLARHSPRITRLVLDEVHLVCLWSAFRPQYCLLKNWMTVSIQKVFLTATLPPKMYSELASLLGLDARRTVVARDSHTQRPEVQYRFELSSDVDQSVVSITRKYLSTLEKGQRVIVFVREISDAERIADLLVDDQQRPIVYHSQVQSRQDRYWDWYRGNQPILIGTSGLYHGIDHSSVVAAVFHDFPETIIEFAQASGRVARGLKFGVSHVVVPMQQHRFAFGDPERQQLLSSLTLPLAEQPCRRLVLGQVLDDKPLTCLYVVDSALCDVCELHKEQRHSQFLVSGTKIPPQHLLENLLQPTQTPSHVPIPFPLPKPQRPHLIKKRPPPPTIPNMPIANSIEERWPLLPSILPSCLVQPESIPDNGPPPHVPVMDKSPSIPLWCFEPAPPPYSRSSPIPAAIPIDESPTNDAPSHLPSVPLSCLIAPNVPPSKEPSMGSNMGSEGVEPRRSSSPERLLGIPYLEGARLLPFEDNTANRDDRLPSIPACCLIAPQADSLMGVCSDVVNDPVLLGWEVGTGFSEQVSPTPSTMLDALRGSNAHEVLSRFHRGCILCLYQTGREVHHASQLSVAPISRPCPFYSLGTPYEVFKQGLHGATPSCVAFHRTVVSEQTYSYCGCCYIDKCRCHPPHHTFCHADESCPGIDDLDEREWYQRLLYLAFRQCWVRDRVAPHFGHSCESPGLGMDNKTVGEWGRWAAHVSAEGMRRGTIVAALACQELHLTSS